MYKFINIHIYTKTSLCVSVTVCNTKSPPTTKTRAVYESGINYKQQRSRPVLNCILPSYRIDIELLYTI